MFPLGDSVRRAGVALKVNIIARCNLRPSALMFVKVRETKNVREPARFTGLEFH